jgi:single-strand DNA-binding protein
VIFVGLQFVKNDTIQIKSKIMSTLKNKVQLLGHLGGDPEVISLESGKKLVKFAIATNETYRNAKGEKVTDTQWHHVVDHLYPRVNGKLAA